MITGDISCNSIIIARTRLERALRYPKTRDGYYIRDRLIKYHLTHTYASHLRAESVMLIRAALAKSRESSGPQDAQLSCDIVEGLSLDSHPMAVAMASAVAAGATVQLRGSPSNGRSSYTAIDMQIGGFSIAVNLDGRIVISDADQLDAALECLRSK